MNATEKTNTLFDTEYQVADGVEDSDIYNIGNISI